MSYVDGFVAAVPVVNQQKYKQHAEDEVVGMAAAPAAAALIDPGVVQLRVSASR